ncbi:MAG: serine/threonine-protein kinase, partial [Verrucomicrobium sp.]
LMEQLMQPTQELESPAALPTLTPAEVAPHFPQLEIMECLGRGGMGVVYKARQKSLNRLVALKLLAPERAEDAEFAGRFEREAQALARLNHPHIVAVHDFGHTGGFYYLIMEFIDGVNLRQLLQAKKLTPQEALSIVPPVCEALQCAHEHGIVHRDIKPENLLIDKEGKVKIADFGIAKLVSAMGSSDAVGLRKGVPDQPASAPTLMCGTPDYAAPEQQDQQGYSDHRADIYSLGVVLYEMLTGERPGKTIEPPSRKVQLDIRIDEIVLRALEKMPELRFATAAEFRTQVETVAMHLQPGGPPPDSGISTNQRLPLFRNKGGWFLLRSPAVQEIVAHLTPSEKWEMWMRTLMFTLWNVTTFFAPPAIGIYLAPDVKRWFIAAAVLLIGLGGFPIWRKIQLEFLCSTGWARQRRMTPEQLVARASEGAPHSIKAMVPMLFFFVVIVASGAISDATGWTRSEILWPAVAATTVLAILFEVRRRDASSS